MTTIEIAPITTFEKTGNTVRRQAAKLAAPDRARAVFHDDPALRLRLHSVDGLSLLHPVRMMPVYSLTGFDAYRRLWLQPNWYTAIENLAIFGVLYIGFCLALGLTLAILLDQKIRGDGVLRPILPLSDGNLVHRHRDCLEMVPQPWPRPRKDDARLGLDELSLRLAHQPEDGDLHHRHCGRLAAWAS